MHYLFFLLPAGILVFFWVFVTYIDSVVPIVGALLVELRVVDNTPDKAQTRNFALAIAAFAGMLAVFSTVPFRLVRTWINERTAKTQEATHITGLINKAVEGLGAEKTVSRIGRVLRFKDGENGKVQTKIEWEREGESSELPDGLIGEPGDWESFNVTKPNLEVRIGAILTLERIARDNPDDHIRVMDILCAYIRENSKAEDVADHPLGAWPEYPENATTVDLEARKTDLKERKEKLSAWKNDLPEAGIDIQKALEVIGNRSTDMIDTVEARLIRGGEKGYRLDLRHTNLRKTDLKGLNFATAQFDRARMEGAHLRMARMEGAELWEAQMEGADLSEARMEGAVLWGARMEGADLSDARMEGADLSEARMEGADLWGARMEGAVLSVARMEGAVLWHARMEGAVLWHARMEGADLSGARMEGADLSGARMEGADLSGASVKSADWAGAILGSSAQSADFRGARNLPQEQLDQMIGDEWTLLPEGNAPDTGEPYSIASCWEEAPPYFEAMMERMAGRYFESRSVEELREAFLCGDRPVVRYSNSLPVDAPYPEGHPLAKRD